MGGFRSILCRNFRKFENSSSIPSHTHQSILARAIALTVYAVFSLAIFIIPHVAYLTNIPRMYMANNRKIHFIFHNMKIHQPELNDPQAIACIVHSAHINI